MMAKWIQVLMLLDDINWANTWLEYYAVISKVIKIDVLFATQKSLIL